MPQNPSQEVLHGFAQIFIDHIGHHRIFAFRAGMGVGKTTFIKALCEVLGVDETVNSPSFSIINEYTANSGERIFHFDFYRLNKPEEALQFGVDDYFDSGNLCFIEWPEKLGALLPDDAVDVFITEQADGSRELKMG
jgi:tRNA threonylcarbamoyladenosine biosynthesis protein TsaE